MSQKARRSPISMGLSNRITSYNVCYTKLLRNDYCNEKLTIDAKITSIDYDTPLIRNNFV